MSSKAGSVMDVIKTTMRFFQNFDKMKKSAMDIATIAGKVIPKKEQAEAPQKEIPRKKKEANNAELVSKALTNLGFKPNEARAVVAYIGDDIDSNSIEESIKDSLAFLRKEKK